MNKYKDYTKILEECVTIAQERQQQYGTAKDSIDETIKILATVFNLHLTPKQFCQVMIAGKLSREKFKHKDDNIRDVINYLAIIESL